MCNQGIVHIAERPPKPFSSLPNHWAERVGLVADPILVEDCAGGAAQVLRSGSGRGLGTNASPAWRSKPQAQSIGK
jgi:hypothetical protein